MPTAFKLAGIVTLLFDAYLLLSLLALSRMSKSYHEWLPPLGAEFAAELPTALVWVIVLWTGLLAIGCIRNDASARALPHT